MEKEYKKVYKKVKQEIEALTAKEVKDTDEIRKSLSSIIRYVKKSKKSLA